MDVRFISYNGEYPNRCSGTLIIEVDGVRYTEFGILSGGECSFDANWNDYVSEGPWEITRWHEGFPEQAKAYALYLFNEYAAWGCCGGCL